LPIWVQEAFRTPNRHDQNKTSPQHVIVKIINTENKEKILKDLREKTQVAIDFSTETLKSRKAWSEELQALNKINFNPKTLYPEMLSIKIKGGIKPSMINRN
jgi:hypothetical protein